MKKFLSVLLTLSMVLALLIVPISAGETQSSATITYVDLGTAETPKNTTTEDNVEYYTDANAVKYIVIRTADQFKAIKGTANYILANDIDLNGAAASGSVSQIIPAGWAGILDGNGKTVGNFAIKGNDAGMFRFSDSNAIVTFKNITFGSSEAPITGAPTGNGSNGVISGKTSVKSMTFDNCVSYVDFSGSKAAVSAFVGQTNCAAATYTFNNCHTYGKITAANKLGAFVANVNANNNKFYFTNCTNNVDITGTSQGVAGFVGATPKTGTDITFTNCINAGNLTVTDTEGYVLGGFVGNATSGTFGTCTFTNCKNTGTLATLNNATVGAFVGKVTSASDVVVNTTEAGFNYNGLVGSHPYGTKTTRGQVLFSSTVSGLQTLSAAKAAYFQTAKGSDDTHINVRVLLVLPEADVKDAAGVELKVVFKLNDNETTKTLTVNDTETALASYYSVIADNSIVEVPEGYVMLAVVIKDVDTTVWSAEGKNLEAYFTVGTEVVYNNSPETANANPQN